MFFVALFAAMLVSLSAFTGSIEAPRTGYRAPALAIGDNGNILQDDAAAGRYRVLTFWSGTDPRSRLDCNDYATMCRTCGIDFMGVNFDRNRELFGEMVKNDGLEPGNQYYPTGKEAAKIIERYHLGRGYKTFLIDPSGKIVAVNPTHDTLAALAGRRVE